MFFSKKATKSKLNTVHIDPTSELKDTIKSQTVMRVASLLMDVKNLQSPPGAPKLKADKYVEEFSKILQTFETLEFKDICDTFIRQLPPTESSSYLGCALAIIGNKTDELIALGLNKKDIRFLCEDLGIDDDGEKRGKNFLIYKILRENIEEEQVSGAEASVKSEVLSYLLTKLIKEQTESHNIINDTNSHRKVNHI